MHSRLFRSVVGVFAAAMLLVTGCSSSNSGSGSSGASDNGSVNTMVSDAPENDWATIGVKILSIALNPQGSGTPVTIFTSSGTAINLVELDQLSEILANSSVTPGTYTSATITMSANPGDVMLTASEDPDAGFAGTAGATVPSNQIQIQGATGTAGNKTVPLTVTFDTLFVVTASQNNSLDLEFDLSHPAFIIAHVPPAAGTVEWAVNFNGPIRHHPIADITRLVLRDIYATVNSVSADNTSLTVSKDYPTEPPASPETAVVSPQTLSILADSTNGTLFYNLDSSPATPTTIMNFSSVATSLPNKFVRIAARYQSNGTLVAVRIWASSSFNTVWQNPEGHVLHANTTTNILSVTNETGGHVPLQITGATQFYFRNPGVPTSDTNPIGTGTAFLSNIQRGFKVHVLANPLTTPATALTVDIEVARFDGSITLANAAGFDYTRVFSTANDDYTQLLHYISSTTPNGANPLTGAPITGFKWWDFSFPTLVNSGTGAINSFVSAAGNGAPVSFAGTVGTVPVYGVSYAVWNDPSALGWDAPWAVLVPSPVPLGSVATAYSSSTGSFTMNVLGGANPATVDVNKTSGSAALVYQVDRTGGVVTVSPVDITTPAGLTTFTNAMVGGTIVKVAGVPESTVGHIQAYVIFYYTGTMPVS